MRYFKHKYSVYIVFFVTICALNLFAQTTDDVLIDFAHPYFDFDYATYSVQEENHTRIEVYLQISNNEFQFIRKNGVYEATAEISIIVENKENNFFREKFHSQKLKAENYEETVASVISQIIQLDFILPTDRYDFTVMVMDKETKRISNQQLTIQLPAYKNNELSLSNLELCHEIETIMDGCDKELGFHKGDRWVVPKPNREYGVDENKLGLYFEIYGLQFSQEDPNGSCLVQYTISDNQGDIKAEKTHRVQKPGPIAAISLNPPIDNLPTGKYDLLVTVLDEQTRTQSFQKASFFRWSYKHDEIVDQIAYSIEALRFVASSDELRIIKETSGENLSAVLQDFWHSKDPTPYTKENEAFVDFYNRYTIANTAFGSKQRPGWETDQGEIFMKYGMPEVIYKDKDPLNITKAEVWVYSSGEQFVFVDKFGFGEFRLLPTVAYR